MKAALALLAAGTACSVPAVAAPTLGAGYGEHMVLQRGQPIVIAGTAAAGSTVRGTLGKATASAVAGADGSFRLTFPARQASADPLTLTLTDPTGTASWQDMLIGDVYLCSGQSNMEFPLDRAIGGPDVIANTSDPQMRLMAIPKDTASQPETSFGSPVAWAAPSPDSLTGFSAPCFFMARKLRADLGIPIGAIGSYWGGSQIRAWLDPIAGERFYGSDQIALLRQNVDDPLGAVTAFAPGWQDWWREHNDGAEPWANPQAVTWQPVPSVGPWTQWEGSPLAKDPVGDVLLRHTIELTAAEAKAGGTLSIGIVDDGDMTFVNGQAVGNTFSWDKERHYPVPAGTLKAGSNEILVVASNGWGPGGFQSTPDRLGFAINDGRTIPLADGWQYAVAKERGGPPRTPWDTIAGIGGMHNRMIAPIGPMRLAGGAWYQGESDVGIPGYADRLAALLDGWRRQFGKPMRMVVVQLPDFGERPSSPTASGWAEVREAERSTVAADPNAALASAIDLGAWDELHPPNKLEVGNRLALGAEGKAMPMPQTARMTGDTVTVTFSGIEGSLQALGGPYALGVELCGETQESCRYALPALTGDRMTIPVAEGAQATRVRYAWSDAPIVNLFDARGLPVPGFELPITQ